MSWNLVGDQDHFNHKTKHKVLGNKKMNHVLQTQSYIRYFLQDKKKTPSLFLFVEVLGRNDTIPLVVDAY